MPRIIVEVKHRDKSKGLATVIENVFGDNDATSRGDWSRHLWLQLASKVYDAYGGSDSVTWVRVIEPGKRKPGSVRVFWAGEIKRYLEYQRARYLLTPEELALVQRFETMRDEVAKWRPGGER